MSQSSMNSASHCTLSLCSVNSASHCSTPQCCRKSPYLVTVFHELREVQQGLRDLGDVLRRQRLLQTLDQLVLLRLTQLGPAGDERGVEQVPETGGRGKVPETGGRGRSRKQGGGEGP